jgi:hypothetical protein
MNRIDEAILLKCERDDDERELDGLLVRWLDWDFWREGREWVGRCKDGLCEVRAGSLASLEKEVKRDEELWEQLFHGRKPPLSDRVKWADANRRQKAGGA